MAGKIYRTELTKGKETKNTFRFEESQDTKNLGVSVAVYMDKILVRDTKPKILIVTVEVLSD